LRIKLDMMTFCEELFPINRSLLGEGNRKTLTYIASILPELKVVEYPSGYKAYDWTVPYEWKIDEAYISDLQGKRLIDFSENNLHVVGYSTPINEVIPFKKLKSNLFTHDFLEDAIPYLTTYYNPTWGFCLTKNQLKLFNNDEDYHVVIKSKLEPGSLLSGEIYLPGESKKEILLTTYICHPSMANNELSGPAVLTALTQWIAQKKNRHFSYRISFHSETIGALCYIQNHEIALKENVVGAWNFTCMGGPGPITMLPSQYGASMPDKVTKISLAKLNHTPKIKDFLSRGSDERQFSSPRLKIPMVSVMKSAYGEYDEYHTSLDNLTFISLKSLNESLSIMKEIISTLEEGKYFRQTFIGEAHMNKYGLYPTLEKPYTEINAREVMNIVQFCDGTNSIGDIAKILGIAKDNVDHAIGVLLENRIIE